MNARLLNAIWHLTLHVGARGLSAVLSLVLFALYARHYSDDQLATVFSFGFLFGFAVATTRIIPQLAARIQGTSSRTQKLRRAKEGIAILKLVVIPVVLAVFTLTLQSTGSIWLAVFAALIVPFAVADIDLFRSILNRSSLFSTSFAAGSVLALMVFAATPTKSLDLAILTIILQWLPVAVLNKRAVVVMARQSLSRAGTLFVSGSASIALATFDGIIINLPFLAIWNLAAAEQVSLGISIRLFVSSLPLVTLLLHWANMSYFDDISRMWSIPKPVIFSLLLVISGMAAGSVFIFAFSELSNRPIRVQEVLGYVLILTAFSIYFSYIRFLDFEKSANNFILLFCILGVCLFSALLFAIPNVDTMTALHVIFCQSAIFITVPILISQVIAQKK